MSTENDVPLGEGAGRYYDRQFGDRIRQVRKGGGPLPGSGGSNWSGRAGIGIAVGVLFVILRIVIAISRTTSSTPSYNYSPPPQPDFRVDLQREVDKADLQKAFDDPARDDLNPEQLALLLQPDEQMADPFLREEEIPFPRGLCYRIQQEGRQPRATPGKRILTLVSAPQRDRIDRVAAGQKLSPREQAAFLETWNDLLRRPDLHDDASFVLVRGVASLLVVQALRGKDGVKDALFNRRLLEKCYPEQIVPLSQRPQFDDAARQKWLDRARADYVVALRQFELASP